jgi:hypothetical protein
LAVGVALCGCGQQAISVTPTLMPPHSLRLSDYYGVGAQLLTVNIVVNDGNISNLPVKLHIKMENITKGVVVETPPTLAVVPIYLNGRVPEWISGSDLAPYFDLNTLLFKGFSREDYRRTGQLPEGFYRITVEVLHFATLRRISNVGMVTAWFALGKPPLLNTPTEGAEAGNMAGMPLTFSWLPSNVGAPTGGIQYTLEMWPLRFKGIDPNVIVASTPVFYSATQMSTTLLVYPAEHLMEQGMRYAWRVTASDLAGLTPFENNGHSQVRTFTYQSKCDSVSTFKAERKQAQNGVFSWTPAANHTSFNIELCNPATGFQKLSQTYDNREEYRNIDYGTAYQLRVQAVCNNDPMQVSDFTSWRTLSIPALTPDSIKCPRCKCENSPKAHPSITNMERKELKVGDTIITKSRRTRLIVKTATPDGGNNTYKGLLYFWAEIWSAKFLCEYHSIAVNTDNVMLCGGFESVNNPFLTVDADKAKEWEQSLADNVAKTLVKTDIRDTAKLQTLLESAYINVDGKLVVAVQRPDGSIGENPVDVGKLQTLDRTLIQDSDGKKYVATKDKQVLGVEEFNATGGNSRLMESYNKEKEAKAAPNVTFTAHSSQQYGFDAYNEKKLALQNEYPELKPAYRTAYKSVASFATDKVIATGVADSYRTEMGIPAPKNGNDLTIRGSSKGSETILYAYAKQDSTEQVVGKLNIVSFDEQVKKIYLVSVNGAQLPNATTLQNELNKIFAPAVTKWCVGVAQPITVAFTGGQMTHGGTGLISVYNADQKAAIKAFGSMEPEAAYLFFVENVKDKDYYGEFTGYMPLQHQAGFLYETPNANAIAHELGHGLFNLRHPFDNAKFIAPQNTTENLMDYKGGTELWKHQWRDIQNPQSIIFSFWQDEKMMRRPLIDLPSAAQR